MNADKVSAYASFSLGTLILSAVSIFEQRLIRFDIIMFDIVLVIFAMAVVSYFVSLHLWFDALEQWVPEQERLHYRHIATTFQTLGWLLIHDAGVLAVLIASTPIGRA